MRRTGGDSDGTWRWQ